MGDRDEIALHAPSDNMFADIIKGRAWAVASCFVAVLAQ